VRLTPRSLRARLTLLFTLGTAVVLGLCLVLLYLTLDRQLAASLDADLKSRSADLADAVRTGDLDVVNRDPMAQLYSSDGGVLAGSPAVAGRQLLSVDKRTAARQRHHRDDRAECPVFPRRRCARADTGADPADRPRTGT
jgi:two-component system OmpR family sensor kinase